MVRLSLRATVWMVAVPAAVVAGLVALYPAVRLIPVARQMSAATAPLDQLYSRLADETRWAGRTIVLAERAVAGNDPLVSDSLERLIGRHDLLTGALPLAEVPDSVRLLLARADETSSRIVAAAEEMLALQRLGRRAPARASLADLHRLEGLLGDLTGRAQVRGLDRVLETQQSVEKLGRLLVVTSLLWLGGLILVIGAALVFLHRRIERPLLELRRALERLREGDLSVVLAPVADDEIGGLVVEFNQMTSVLRARAQVHGQMAAASELLAGVAHQVNNPLMVVTSTVEELLSTPNLPDRARQDLFQVLEQARHAGKLLRAIVRFVRPRVPTRRPVCLNEVVRDAWDLMAARFSTDGMKGTLTLAPDLPRVQADAQRLEHVFVSLLANAHQALRCAGQCGSEVRVRTWAEDGNVCGEVCDTGTGVAPEMLSRLFQPFTSSRADGHVGLGLYAARLIVREYGGEISYAPSGRGARFVVALPAGPAVGPEEGESAAEEPEAADGAPAAAPPLLAGMRVLVVDDEPMMRVSLQRFLVRKGATVRVASEGSEALALLAAGPSDVVVTDLRMPGMDGVALFRALRASQPVLAERVLFLSGDVAQLGDLDPDEIPPERVLSKPVKLAEFERTLLQFKGS